MPICFLIGAFEPFTSNVTINMLWLKCHFIFCCLFVLFFIPLVFIILSICELFEDFKTPFWFICSAFQYIFLYSYFSGCSRYYIIYMLIHNLLQSMGGVILSVQVNYRNLTSPNISLPSHIYNCLKYFLHIYLESQQKML